MQRSQSATRNAFGGSGGLRGRLKKEDGFQVAEEALKHCTESHQEKAQKRARRRARIPRKLYPTPHRMAFIASPSILLRKFFPVSPSPFMCPISSSMAALRHVDREFKGPKRVKAEEPMCGLKGGNHPEWLVVVEFNRRCSTAGVNEFSATIQTFGPAPHLVNSTRGDLHSAGLRGFAPATTYSNAVLSSLCCAAVGWSLRKPVPPHPAQSPGTSPLAQPGERPVVGCPEAGPGATPQGRWLGFRSRTPRPTPHAVCPGLWNCSNWPLLSGGLCWPAINLRNDGILTAPV
jgi:hypothetical protein